MSKIKKFMPLVEYIVVAFSNWSSTRDFKDRERLKIFFILTRKAFFCILIMNIIGKTFIEPIADAVFSVGSLPIIFQPLCLFVVKRNLNLRNYLS